LSMFFTHADPLFSLATVHDIRAGEKGWVGSGDSKRHGLPLS